MEVNQLPKMSFDAPETHCCAPFVPEAWDNQTIEFRDKLFVRATCWGFMYIPLTMNSMMNNTFAAIEAVDARGSDEFVVLSHDLSPWKSEHLFSVTKEVPDAEMVRLSGTFRTKVFEGPYQKVGAWGDEVRELLGKEETTVETLYWFYTTCPKCAKHYGKNFVVAFAKVA